MTCSYRSIPQYRSFFIYEKISVVKRIKKLVHRCDNDLETQREMKLNICLKLSIIHVVWIKTKFFIIHSLNWAFYYQSKILSQYNDLKKTFYYHIFFSEILIYKYEFWLLWHSEFMYFPAKFKNVHYISSLHHYIMIYDFMKMKSEN